MGGLFLAAGLIGCSDQVDPPLAHPEVLEAGGKLLPPVPVRDYDVSPALITGTAEMTVIKPGGGGNGAGGEATGGGAPSTSEGGMDPSAATHPPDALTGAEADAARTEIDALIDKLNAITPESDVNEAAALYIESQRPMIVEMRTAGQQFHNAARRLKTLCESKAQEPGADALIKNLDTFLAIPKSEISNLTFQSVSDASGILQITGAFAMPEMPLNFRKTGEGWRIEFPSLEQVQPMILMSMNGLTTQLTQFEDQITKGEATVQDVATQVDQMLTMIKQMSGGSG